MINWYPGHIAKATRDLKAKIALVDALIELVDARAPESSRFSLVDDLAKQKQRVVVLNKADLADPELLKQWLQLFRQRGLSVVAIESVSGKGIPSLHGKLNEHHQALAAKMKAKGRLARPLRVMVVGPPNVGKSSLINRLVGKRKAHVANKPGVTRAASWIRIGEGLELIDTPGVIPPKLDDQERALKLAMIGSVSQESYDPLEVARAAFDLFGREFPRFLEKLGAANLEEFAKARNCLGPGGGLDLDRAAKTFMADLRSGRLGRMTLDLPAQNT